MSFDYLVVTPSDPLFVPELRIREASLELLLRLRPTETWRMDVFDAPHVYVGPDSFEGAACPRCRTKPSIFVDRSFPCAPCRHCGADLAAWCCEEIDSWWARETRRDLAVLTPCCGVESTLDAVTRDLPISFACFAVGLATSAGRLCSEELDALACVLGAPARSFRAREIFPPSRPTDWPCEVEVAAP